MTKKKYLHWIQKLSEVFSEQKKILSQLAKIKVAIEELDIPENESPAEKSIKESDLSLPADFNKEEFQIALFTDGACRGNPGPGSWAAMGQDNQGQIILKATGIQMKTTNNIMELLAVKEGLVALLDQDYEAKNTAVKVYSDSRYVVDGMTTWIHSWKNRGWKKADNKGPENLIYWQELDATTSLFQKVNFQWVRGHDGHAQNEFVDQLANQALNEAGF
jgi:ribonuclease HI